MLLAQQASRPTTLLPWLQVDKLKGVYELVVNKQPSLIDEFLPEVVELQVDPAPAVRKYLPEFVAGAGQVGAKVGSCVLVCVWMEWKWVMKAILVKLRVLRQVFLMSVGIHCRRTYVPTRAVRVTPESIPAACRRGPQRLCCCSACGAWPAC